MHKRRLRAPSPAFVISLLALFVALGGTTYAATSLPKNSVGTKQLKNNAVTGPKIKKGAVTAAKINTKGLTAPNALHATSADSATNATNADNATTVGGETVKKFDYTSATATTSLTTVVQFGTFTLQARCNAGAPDLELTSSVANWGLGGTETDNLSGGTNHSLFNYNQAAGTNIDLTAAGHISGGYVTATTPDGHVITIIYHLDSHPTLGTNQCLESGVAIGS